MADTYVQGSFAFRCLQAEADLLIEAISALGDMGCDDIAAAEPGHVGGFPTDPCR